ncbi:hypothetical protein QYF61_025310 [Mycteria americana]|uniref:Uncharacterized protein n=1 Tax=Mycteria americana TaxID=33587 RepID=A0AAN7RVY0_MYCAM|nr:hypothetical protein QYF61_025310 [Mycteria americana]
MGLPHRTVVVYIKCLRDVIAKVWNNHLLLESCCCKNRLTGRPDPNLQQTTTQGSAKMEEGALVNPRATSDGHQWTPQRSGRCHVCHHACRLPTGGKISPLARSLPRTMPINRMNSFTDQNEPVETRYILEESGHSSSEKRRSTESFAGESITEAQIAERAKNEGVCYGSRGDSPREPRQQQSTEQRTKGCQMWVMDARGEKLQKTGTGPCHAGLPSLYYERKVTSAKQAHNETLNSTAKVPSASAFHTLLVLCAVPAALGSAGEVQRCHTGGLLGTSQSRLCESETKERELGLSITSSVFAGKKATHHHLIRKVSWFIQEKRYCLLPTFLDILKLKYRLQLEATNPGNLPLEQVAQSPIQPGLEHFQGWGITAALGNLLQCLTTLTVKNFFLVSNLNLPSFSLKPSPLVYHYMPFFPAGPLQVLEGCYKVSPQPSLLQAEPPQLSQPVFIGEVLQPTDHLHGPPLDSLQQLHVLLMLGTPELDAVLQVGPHQHGAEGRITSLDLLATLLLMQPRDLALGLVELHEVQTGPPLKSVKVPPDGIPSLQCVDCTTQLGVISKLAEGALNPTVHVTNKDVKQCRSQYRPLRNATCHCSPLGH